MLKQIKKFLKEEDGATAVEYGLIAGLIAVAIAATLSTLGGHLNEVFTNIDGKIAPAQNNGNGGDAGAGANAGNAG